MFVKRRRSMDWNEAFGWDLCSDEKNVDRIGGTTVHWANLGRCFHTTCIVYLIPDWRLSSSIQYNPDSSVRSSALAKIPHTPRV